MTLNLANPVASSVERNINLQSKESGKLASGLSTGIDETKAPVTKFLYRSLDDSRSVFEEIKEKMTYPAGIIDNAKSSLDTLGNIYRQALETVASAGAVSQEKLESLNSNIAQLMEQANLLIETTEFDGKYIFKGDAGDLTAKMGLGVDDEIQLGIQSLDGGKLGRTGAANLINDYIGKQLGRTGEFGTQDELDDAVMENHNFTQDATLTDSQLSKAIVAVRENSHSFERIEKSGEEYIPYLENELMSIRMETVAENAAGTDISGDTNVDDIKTAIKESIDGSGTGDGLSGGDDLSTVAGNMFTDVEGAANTGNTSRGVEAAVSFIGFYSGSRDMSETESALADIIALEDNADGTNGIASDANATDIAEAASRAFVEAIYDSKTDAEAHAAIDAAVADTAADTNTNLADLQTEAKAIYDDFKKAYDTGSDEEQKGDTLLTASEADLTRALGQGTAYGPAGETQTPKEQLLDNFKDNQELNLLDEKGRNLAQDVLAASLEKIRANQADVDTKSKNLEQAIETLGEKVEQLRSTASSFGETDYAEHSSRFSESIRSIQSGIASMQAMNKVPEAAQQMVQNLAR